MTILGFLLIQSYLKQVTGASVYPLVTWREGTGTAWSLPAVTYPIPVSLTLPQAGPLPSLCLIFVHLSLPRRYLPDQATPESQCPQPGGPR